MLSKCLEEIKPGEIDRVFGGLCQCSCDRKQDGTDPRDIGKAKSLEECSRVCLANGWKIESCITSASKKDAK